MSMEMLKELYLFKKLTPEQLAPIEREAMLCGYKKGEKIFSEGDESSALYIVQSGSVEMRQSAAVDKEMLIATFSKGSHFGEMGYLDRGERSAHAVCTEDCKVILIDYDDLEHLCSRDPETASKIYLAFAQFLASRLRMTTKKLTTSKEATWLLF